MKHVHEHEILVHEFPVHEIQKSPAQVKSHMSCNFNFYIF